MSYWGQEVEIEKMVGETFLIVKSDEYTVYFIKPTGDGYALYHEQDCCESVTVEDVVGDLDDLASTPILDARMDTNSSEPHGQEYEPESYTWTFFNFRTIKGSVTIRFYGTSNGYYGETARVYALTAEQISKL